ncbi:hypothetical protein GN244_ATG06254 [Phytophthora infestans]|uniref:Uncharacterized protein n=1 Tax=Phytophthora infestans TaxID=4787 RepID=A0A833S6A4_PHYIN|nr:hypothetical protein GN244_ATG06254 [Phytophthora infestans]
MSSDGGVIAVENATTTEAAASRSVKPKRKKAFLFLPSSDIFLLKEAIKHTPWAAGHGGTLQR